VISYEVSNRISSPVVLEDIGVRLSPSGSPGSVVTISQSLHDASSDLVRLKGLRCVSISILSPPSKVRALTSVWPLSALVRPSPSPPPAPLALAPPPPAPPASLSGVEARLSEIVSLLASGTLRLPSQPTTSAEPRAADPMFVPSKIVPDAESTITVAATVSDSPDFDASAEALNRIRKRR
jgi:hypothetical protein